MRKERHLFGALSICLITRFMKEVVLIYLTNADGLGGRRYKRKMFEGCVRRFLLVVGCGVASLEGNWMM